MNKVSANFKLTNEGKLPPKSNLVCYTNGIYVFLINREVIRFGESGSGFVRIRKGFNHQLYRKNGKKNYHAYHFRDKFKSQNIEIRYYSVKGSLLLTPESRRAIEAELTYLYRTKKGAWPRSMTEIHFSNNRSKSQKNLVSEILNDLCIK